MLKGMTLITSFQTYISFQTSEEVEREFDMHKVKWLNIPIHSANLYRVPTTELNILFAMGIQ